MNEKLLPFLKALNDVSAGVFGRDILIRHAVALAISDLSTLPTGPVDNIEASFNNFARLRAEEIIAEFNEVSPLNFAATLNLVRAYWIARYKAAFGVSRVFSGTDYINTIGGLANAISPDDLKVINERLSTDFSYLYDLTRKVVASLLAAPTK